MFNNHIIFTIILTVLFLPSLVCGEQENRHSVGYDSKGFDLVGFSEHFEEIEKNKKFELALESRVNYPDFWGEKPPENEFDTLYKSIYPFYISRISSKRLLKFTESYLTFDKSLVNNLNSNVTNIYTNKPTEFDIKSQIKDFNVVFSGKKLDELELLNEVNNSFDKLKFHRDFIINFNDNNNDNEIAFNKKYFFKNYKNFTFFKKKVKHLIGEEDFNNKEIEDFLLSLNNIENKYNAVIDSMMQINFIKDISSDNLFSFDEYMKNENINKNKGRIRKGCFNGSRSHFTYYFINSLNQFPVEFNVRDLIAYDGPNEFTKILIHLGDYKEYFILENINTRYDDALMYKFTQINGYDYFYFIVEKNQLINSERSNNFKLNGRLNKITVKDNKGYIYEEKREFYGFSCKGPFNFID